MGYTPLFETLLSGTLYGRWPHTGVWACLLSRVSREGTIDETPKALADAIGVSVETLNQCIQDFMAPDTDSRSQEEEGRRLVLIDTARTWGWRVVNHSKYREKARKKAYDEKRTESGEDAARKQAQRAGKNGVPTSPDAGRRLPLSEQLIASPNAEQTLRERTGGEDERWETKERCEAEYPKGTYRGTAWHSAERDIGRLLDSGELAETLVQRCREYSEQCAAKGWLGTQFILSPANFFKGDDWRGPFPLPAATSKTKLSDNLTWKPTE